jgi:hypothetical protein
MPPPDTLLVAEGHQPVHGYRQNSWANPARVIPGAAVAPRAALGSLRSQSIAGLVATAKRCHVLKRLNVKLAVPGQREVNPLGHRGRTGSMYE